MCFVLSEGGPRGKVAFYTLGCKVNRYDTEAMAELFRRAGWEIVDFRDMADVYVVNTCTVTARSEAQSRQAVRQARRRNPAGLVVVCGCYPQVQGEEALSATGADVVLGTRGRGKIVSLVERALRGEKPLVEVAPGPAMSTRPAPVTPEAATAPEQYEEVPVVGQGRTRAILKVQEGCNMRCTYCIVPAARGHARSRDPGAALEEARRLVAAGFREIVLTGIQLGAYGRDLGIPDGLAWLVEKMAAIGGLWRLRLSSIEPVDLTDALVGTMASQRVVCPHLHLPLQSGSDRVLAAMGRPYSAGDYLRLVERAREKMPGMALSTDVMVGFPGETDEDFAATLQVVEKAGFMRLHVFPYSPRPGTAAARLPDGVPEKVKEERARVLRELGMRLGRAFAEQMVGQVVEVLAEREQDGQVSGLTRNYVRVRFPGGPELEGCLVEVRVIGADPDGARGELTGVLAAPEDE
ncbi:MAG: tRNA (N(6)-L-threonylcarbamoyladenosine(37)-C(2))-methylthiotransferase MtaB [Bacillota bacterium]